jgi:hypothetical protein
MNIEHAFVEKLLFLFMIYFFPNGGSLLILIIIKYTKLQGHNHRKNLGEAKPMGGRSLPPTPPG